MVRPVTGPVRSRFLAHLLANTPVQPREIPPKSLFPNILSITALFAICCTGIRTYPQQNKDLGGGGRGYPSVPNWEVAESRGRSAKGEQRIPSLHLQWTPMIRNIIVPRVLGKTQEDLQPAIELFRALGATPVRECDDGSAQGYQLEAPRGTVEFLASGAHRCPTWRSRFPMPMLRGRLSASAMSKCCARLRTPLTALAFLRLKSAG